MSAADDTGRPDEVQTAGGEQLPEEEEGNTNGTRWQEGPSLGDLYAQTMRPLPLVGPEDDGDDFLLAQEPRTDHGNARRLVARYRNHLRYVPAWKSWLVWDRYRWAEDDRNWARNLARVTAMKIWDEADALLLQKTDSAEVDKHARWWTTSQSASRIDAMLRLAESDQNIIVTPDMLDEQPCLLNLINGTLDLEAGELRRPHRREDLITALAPVSYRGDEPCDLDCAWEWFVATVVPDPETRAFLQRYSAYAVSGASDRKVATFLHGNADTGKTTFVESLRRVLGPDYTVEVAETLLVATRSEQHPTEVVDLHRKRLASVSELESGKRFDVAKFKKFTGGDRLKGRRMNRDFFEWDPTHAFIMTGNRKPEVRGGDDAFWRRMRIVRFDVVIPRENQWENFAQHIADEHGECVLAWLVRGMRDLAQGGLAEPDGVIVATDDYRRDEDHVTAFIEDAVLAAPGLDPRAFVNTAEMQWAYESWCMRNGVGDKERLGSRALKQELTARGWVRAQVPMADGTRPRCWLDVRLRSDQGVNVRV